LKVVHAMNAGVIILSGGKSSRMGTNKALLKIAEKPNVERIKEEMALEFDQILLVTNEMETYQFLNIPLATDQYPGKGPLAGIHAGLIAATSEINLVVACDMPFVSAGFGKILVEHIKEFDAVVPVIAGNQHPLFAVYHKRILPELENCLVNHNLRMKHLLEKVNVLYMTEKDFEKYDDNYLQQIFFNMNHPDEYIQAKKWVET
jgi:molybdenum cofactor guanylyltransferase